MKLIVSPKPFKSINASWLRKERCFTCSGIRYVSREHSKAECSLWSDQRPRIRSGDSASAPAADPTDPDKNEDKEHYITMNHSATESWHCLEARAG